MPSDPNERHAVERADGPPAGDRTLPALFEDSAARHADRPAQRYKGGVYDRSLAGDVVPAADPGTFGTLTYGEMRSIVRTLAAGFRDLGIARGDRVGIFAHTRMEWAQADFALLAAGAVVTTVYADSSPRQVRYLLSDPGASAAVVENADCLDRLREVEGDLDLSFVVVVDDPGPAGDRDDVYTLADVHDRGAAAFEEGRYREWIDGADPDDLASLIYTSGTTGQPKGVRLTHRNFAANIEQVRRRFAPRPDAAPGRPAITADLTTISFLPLPHVFERTAGHFLMFDAGATVAYAETPDTLTEDLALVGPDTAMSVPRVHERIYESIREEAAGSSVSARIADWAMDVAREWGRTDDPGFALRARHALADRLVFSRVRERLGGEVDFLISGGGSLDASLCRLFAGMGIDIYEGYGLTETAPVVSVNPPDDPRPGTLGPPVVGLETRLDGSVVDPDHLRAGDGEVGELLVRGPNVTDGYWNDPEATGAAFRDDWFRTGDVIERTDDGYLVYRDRLKQLLVLDTGKNVAPGPIESAFATSGLVDQVMVVGDGRKFVGALVVPDFEAVRRLAERRGVELPDDRDRLCEHDRVREWIAAEVDRVNEAFERHERIKRFELVPAEWTTENDFLTPSLKKKRHAIRRAFADRIERIYEGRAPAVEH